MKHFGHVLALCPEASHTQQTTEGDGSVAAARRLAERNGAWEEKGRAGRCGYRVSAFHINVHNSLKSPGGTPKDLLGVKDPLGPKDRTGPEWTQEDLEPRDNPRIRTLL